jgi:hypothetical protein
LISHLNRINDRFIGGYLIINHHQSKKVGLSVVVVDFEMVGPPGLEPGTKGL